LIIAAAVSYKTERAYINQLFENHEINGRGLIEIILIN